MSSLLLYIGLSSISLMLFVLGYQFFLKDSTQFNLSRFYLIASILLSFLIPSLPIDLGIGLVFANNTVNNIQPTIKVVEQSLSQTQTLPNNTIAKDLSFWDIDFIKIIGIVFLSISILLLIRFVFRFGSIILIHTSGNKMESDDGLNLIFTNRTDNAFSFLGYIFINPLKFTDEEKRLIIEHEREHIRHFHSIDLILIELLIVFQWFNPFAYIARRNLIEIHEFIADNGVIQKGADPYSYQNLLLSVVTSSCLPTVGNQLSALITKKRIAMIGKPMNQTGRWINFLVIIPIAALLIVGVSAFTPSKPIEKKQEISNSISSVLTDTTSFKDLKSRAQDEIKDTWLKDFKLNLAPNSSEKFSVILKDNCIYNIYYYTSNGVVLKGKIEVGNDDKKQVIYEITIPGSTKLNFMPDVTGAYHLIVENNSQTATKGLMVLTLNKIVESKTVKVVDSGMNEIVVTAKRINNPNAVQVDTVKNIQEVKDNNEEQPFMVVEQMPKFGNNDDDFRMWVAQNMKYPEYAAAKGIQGRVFVQFIIEKDGSVKYAKILRGVDPSLDKEALRVVMKSPKWTPGKQRGQDVRVCYTFPITFVLQQ